MATRIVINQAAVKQLMHKPVDMIAARVAAIAAACNGESSWGGYDSAAEVTDEGAMGIVWSIGENDDEARENRMVRNLGAGG